MAIGNLIEQEDMAKGLPDDVLLREAEQPSGQLPQFLLISEVQRRTDMRKRYQMQMQKAEPTVAEQIMQEGIAGVAQPPPEMQQAMNGGPPPMDGPPPMAGPQLQPPPQMAYQAGGVVGMQGGREVPAQIPDSLLNKVPSSIVEDAMKFSPFPSDQDDDAEGAVLETKDMGVPKVIDKKGGKSNIVRNLLGMASNLRDRARFEVGGRGGSGGTDISSRVSTTLPIGRNVLELGARGAAHLAPGSNSAQLSELDAIFNMLDKNRSIRGYYQPGGGGVGFNLQQRFNQGGVIGMQNGSTVPYPGDIINFAEDSERRNIANSNNSPRVMTVAELEIIANKSNRSNEKKNSGGGVVKMDKGGLLDTEGGLLDTYITKMGDLFGKKTTPPDYSELIDIASNTKDDKLAIALTSIGASIASGEGFAKGAKEATDKISEMNKDKRNAITALRLAQLRGASEAEIADLKRDVAIAGGMLQAIPKPVTPEARSELQKTLADMDDLEKSGQTNTEKYSLLEQRAKTIATKVASMSEIQGEVIGPILKLIAAGKYDDLTKGQKKIYEDHMNMNYLNQMFKGIVPGSRLD